MIARLRPTVSAYNVTWRWYMVDQTNTGATDSGATEAGQSVGIQIRNLYKIFGICGDRV